MQQYFKQNAENLKLKMTLNRKVNIKLKDYIKENKVSLKMISRLIEDGVPIISYLYIFIKNTSTKQESDVVPIWLY